MTSEDDDKGTCPICLDPNKVLVTTNCDHHACGACAWRIAATSKKCWTCRQPLTHIRDNQFGQGDPVEVVDDFVDYEAEPTSDRVPMAVSISITHSFGFLQPVMYTAVAALIFKLVL